MYEDLYELIKIIKFDSKGQGQFYRNSEYISYISKIKRCYTSFFKGIELRFRDTNRNNPLLQVGKDVENKLKDLLRFIQYNKKPISVNSKNIYSFDEAIHFLNDLCNDMNPDIFEDENINNLFAQILIIAYLNYRMDKINDSTNIEYWSSYNLSWKGFPTFYAKITERFLDFLKIKEISTSECILKQNNKINECWREFIEPFSNRLKEFFISESKKEDSIIKTIWSKNIEDMNHIEDILYELVLYNILLFHHDQYIKNITHKLYKLIFVESADKLGKTSFCEDIQKLEISWDKRDQKIQYFHFPSKEAYEKFPKFEIPELRQLGFTFDTLEYLKKLIKDMFDNNTILLIDRAILSTAVYSFLDFKTEDRYDLFISLLNDLYDQFFNIEKEILKFVSMYQFVIVSEEPEKMKIEFDKDDVIEKDLELTKWIMINNLYRHYLERDEKLHCLAQDLPLGELIKHYKIIYNNNENISVEEKRKERIDLFSKLILN